MATRDELNTIMGQALKDAAFRRSLLADPKAAAATHHVTLDAHQIATIQGKATAITAAGNKLDTLVKDMAANFHVSTIEI